MGVVRKGNPDVVTKPALHLGGVGAAGYRSLLIPADGAHDCGCGVRASVLRKPWLCLQGQLVPLNRVLDTEGMPRCLIRSFE